MTKQYFPREAEKKKKVGGKGSSEKKPASTGMKSSPWKDKGGLTYRKPIANIHREPH